MAQPPSRTVPIWLIPCSCTSHHTHAQRSPSTSTSGMNACPHMPAVDIDRLHRGLAVLAAVVFIQSQRARRRGLVVLHSVVRTLARFFDDASDLPHAQSRSHARFSGSRECLRYLTRVSITGLSTRRGSSDLCVTETGGFPKASSSPCRLSAAQRYIVCRET
jgi:hypothetical protein